ncbi:MAG: SIMPL domain-containing protein [Nonlabens sp.]
MKKYILLFAICSMTLTGFAQTKNFIDQPYLETSATVDTLVTPDRIHLTIVLSESDSRNKKSTERLEQDMIKVLESLKIDVDKDLTVANFDSNYRKYFLRSKKVLKTKIYKLVVKDAYKLSQVFTGLEEEDISNVSVTKAEYSKKDELLQLLKIKSIKQAKKNADALTKALDQKVVKAIRISDQSRFVNWSPRDNSVNMMAMESKLATEENSIQNINFQDLKFSTTVNVTFAIE